MKEFASKFLPAHSQILMTLAMIVLVVHSWSVRFYFFRFPSYMLYLDIGQLAAVFAYYMAFALLESLAFLLILLVVQAILPANWYRNAFAVTSFPVVLAAAISAYLLQNTLTNDYPGARFLILWAAATLAAMVALVLLVRLLKPATKLVNFLAEQISIMNFLYIPIGVISLIVVLVRLVI